MNTLPEKIQKLIDGQLDDHERRPLLESLDQEHPEGWRHLALGFIEAQLFKEALQCIPTEVPQKTPSRPSLKIWNIAAALIIGLLAGTLIHPARSASSTTAEIVTENTPPKSSSLHLGGSSDNRFQIPILDGSAGPKEADLALRTATAPIHRIDKAYRDQGLNPGISTSYITADLDDGNRLVIPISYLATKKNK